MPDGPIRVLHVRSSRGYYGAEAVIEVLARAQADRGDHVAVACLRDRREPHTELLDRLRDAAATTHAVASSGRIDPCVPLRIAALASRLGADVLHVHDYKTILLGLPAALLARVPWVTTFHGEVADDRAVSVYERAARVALRAAGGVAVVSREQQRLLAARGVSTVFIPNAVDVDAIGVEVQSSRAAGDTLKQRLRLPEGAFVIGTVGRLCADKGQVEAFDALEATLAAHPHVHWVIVGNGDDGPALAARVAASKVGARVHLAGYVKERGPLYGGLDALLHPSHREGLSMVILEAMAAGLPIAATPVGEVGSLLDDGCGAILTDRGPAVTRALTTVISDREFRQELGAQARNRVARTFSSATLSHTYAHELYTPAMARRPL